MRRINFMQSGSGLIGEIIDQLSHFVEANPESLLIQLLACFGSCIGKNAYFCAAEDRHFGNLFVALVGKSSRGRKGQSLNVIKELFKEVDPHWSEHNIKKGLSSGEGLIFHVKDNDFPDLITGENIFLESRDKRLLCVESEFSSVLKVTQRDGNVLSQILRDAWDSADLQTLTKNTPLRAKAPHITVIGHITITEMLKYLNSTEINNGLGNRFIYIKAEAVRKLPFAEPIPNEVKKYFSKLIKVAIEKSEEKGELPFSVAAKPYWENLYRNISEADASIVGSLTARQEPQIRRMALIIALINGLDEIDLNSLKFAEEIYNYSIATLKEIYGDLSGDPLADKLHDLLKANPDGLSRSQIHEKLSKNFQKSSLDSSLNLLRSQGLIDFKKEETFGRRQEIWRLCEKIENIPH